MHDGIIAGLRPTLISPVTTDTPGWVERGTVRPKCLVQHAQEHNTMLSARALIRSARFGVECTNHKVTAGLKNQIFTKNVSLHWDFSIQRYDSFRKSKTPSLSYLLIINWVKSFIRMFVSPYHKINTCVERNSIIN